MTPEGAQIAFAFLDLDVTKAAYVFGKTKRTVWAWLETDSKGPPDHVAAALDEMTAGRLPCRRAAVKGFLKRVGSTRRDGDRYDQAASSSARSEKSA